MSRTPVQVYWNFTRKCWSVVDARTGLVAEHASDLFLIDATFRVSEAGRQRVLRERRKNVHARVCGIKVEEKWGRYLAAQTRVRYNPYRDAHFVTDDGFPVQFAQFAAFYPQGTLLCGGIKGLYDHNADQLARSFGETGEGLKRSKAVARATTGRRKSYN
jgi:hypothetical protein